MKREDEGIAARPVCITCGSTIWTTSNTKRRKYCSIECTRKAGAKNMLALRYAAPKPLASRGEFAVGQRVNVPSVQRMTIGGEVKKVEVKDTGAVRKLTPKFVYVSVGNTTRRCTRAQLAACAPKELAVQFGHAISVGGDAS